MKEPLLKIIKNEVTISIIVALVPIFVGWIKNWQEMKKKNKQLGFWKIKYRKVNTFIDVALKIYKWLAICFIVIHVSVNVIEILYNIKLELISFILHLGTGIAFMIIICKKDTNIIELWSNKRNKIIALVLLYIIYVFMFLIEVSGKYIVAFEIAFMILLFVWMCLLYRICDMVFVLDNQFADIYVRGVEKVQRAEAGSLRKQGEWIVLERRNNGIQEQIRIKESDIVRVDYYGEPIIKFVKNIIL